MLDSSAADLEAEPPVLVEPNAFQQLPLEDLEIEQDTLNVFSDLGIRRIEELLQIPTDELVKRYGQEFVEVIDVIQQNGRRLSRRMSEKTTCRGALSSIFRSKILSS